MFSPTTSYLSLPDGSKIPLETDNGLWWLPCTFPRNVPTSATHASPVVPVAAPSPVLSKSLIHRRLCHLHDDGIRRLAAMHLSGIPQQSLSQPLPFCRCRVLGKSTVADISRRPTRHNDPRVCFYMMAADLWGPVDTAAIGGYKYVLGAICYLSGYHLAELLRSKSEAAAAWRRMLLQIRSLGFTVQVLRIDNDSVFLGSEFRSVCDEFSIDIQRTAPYRHH